MRALGSEGGGGANCAAVTVGVIGDTGGRFGEPDSERLRSRSWSRSRCSVVVEEEVLEGDTGRVLVVFVSTRSAGMAARWRQRGGGRDVLPVENRGPPKLWGGGQHGAALIGELWRGIGTRHSQGSKRDESAAVSTSHVVEHNVRLPSPFDSRHR
jgi:hypothetical protein